MPEVTSATRGLRRVAPLALILCLAAGCGDDDKGTATPSEPPPPSTTTLSGGTTVSGETTVSGDTTPMPTVPTATGKNGKPSLLMGKRNLLLLLEGDLRRFAPTQVEGKSLEVVALAGPEAFWAGQKPKRILVKMRVKGGPSLDVKVGQKVDFVGTLTATGDDPTLGVRTDELLTKQGAYVDVSAADVKLR